MRIQKSAMKSRNRRVMAETDIADEATDLLFEAEDVAELIAEVTGEDVDVATDGDTVEFSVGEETYTCDAEPSDEVVESATRIPRMSRSKRRVSASTNRRYAGRTVRKMKRN